MAKGKPFNGRGLVSLLVAGGFVVMAVSGIMLFLSPQGRIAHWVDWTLLGATKDQWSDLHIVAGVLFLGAGIWHLINNWKPFLHHLRRKAQGMAVPRREGLLALLLLALLSVGALLRVPPVTAVLDLNETVRALWASDPADQPPFGHAEEVSLAGLAYRIHKNPADALEALTGAGLSVPDGQRMTLRAIADVNGMTPSAVFAVLERLPETDASAASPSSGGPWTAAAVEARFAGSGVGRRTLADLAAEIGQPVEALLWRLSEAGVPAGPEDRLKPLAEAAGRAPLDVLILAFGAVPSAPAE